MKIRTKRRVPYVSQMVQTECGLCCCAMILNYYKSNETLLDLREVQEIGRDGLSMRQLQKILTDKSFESKMYKVTVDLLPKINMPVIAHWNNDHFIIIEKIKKSYVYIVDPARGFQKITVDEFAESFSHFILTACPTEEFTPQKKKRNSPWKFVFQILTQKKKQIFLATMFSIISYLIMLQIPIFTRSIIDNTKIFQNTNTIYDYFWLIIMISLVYFSILMARGISYIYLNVATSKDLVAKTFSHLLKIPFKFFEVRTSGDLMYRLGSLNGVRELLTSQIIGGCIDFGALIFILFYMMNSSASLTMVAVGIFMANMIFMVLTRNLLAVSINNEIIHQTKSQSIQIETLYSIASIKMSGIENKIYDTWNQVFEKVLLKYKSRSIIQNIINSVNGTFQTVGPLVILIIGVYLFINHKLSLGEVVAFQTLSTTFFGLSTSLFGVYTQYLLTTQYLERVQDIWEQQLEHVPENPIEHILEGNLEMRNVSFSYTSNTKPVVKNINFCVQAGQKVAIVGPSGSGKSTLSKLLVGLYKPTSGEVFYDGISIYQLDKQTLNSQIGIVPQDITLLNKSIYENMTMNNEDVNEEEVIEVAKIANIDNEIQAMPMKYHTVVSEMGLNLSGGQRQRIVLAKALLNKPKIIVLDEATSSLDMINESNISTYLKNLGCTRVVIAHRLSTVMDSDVIYVMNNGEIVEKGNHAELMKLEGLYFSLYKLQGDVEDEILV
ncbi:peptidase domain-containing ABC transporter [Bacillus sp. CLL-7-23]|uniref:Peptidase domain-containing ABC transporter n=1 Tax=Bacillus changyiensis TaxID=3004103 RepID=A0ABT4WYW1_9BACI|nr:peptidase domain-containing ABC transporter [Bacillus changyiensis]MDA7025120.1 peptidase domain-containing ABC transporter [Bacillus changyiensis]